MTDMQNGFVRVMHARDRVIRAKPNDRAAALQSFRDTADEVERAGVAPDYVQALRQEVNASVSPKTS